MRTVWLDAADHPRHVSVGQLWDLFTRYPYLDRVRDRRVFDEAVLSTVDNPLMWETEGFALAQGYDEDAARYVGLVLSSESASFGQITDATLLVHPAVASIHVDPADDTPAESGDRVGLPRSGDSVTPPAASRPARTVRYRGSYPVSAERYGRDLSKVAQEVLPHLAAVEGARLRIRVEIQAEAPDGFSPESVRVVSENAATLRFDESGFEQGTT